MESTLHLHPSFTVGDVDPRIFGGFLEHLGRAVNDGVYRPESPNADDLGCPKPVLDALRELDFTAMRYPGGNFVSGYHWLDGVGPKEKRPVVRDLAWQSLENNHFGTNEFLTLSQRMGWTPMMAVNLGTGTPEEARNWLEYTNIDGGSKWADLRRSHGYEQPFNVKLWCLGNEMDGHWQIGHVPAEVYAIQAQQTARMMRMLDPEIELVACGSCGTGMSTYLEWDRKVLEICRDEVDYLSLHSYVGNSDQDTENYLAVINGVDTQIEASDAVCQAVHHTRKTKKRVYLSFDEWNVWYRARDGEFADGKGKFAPPLLEERYNVEDALVVAMYLNSFIRHADSVKIANIAQIVNVIAPILTKGDELFRQTIFYPFEMFSKRRKGVSLQTSVEGPSYNSKSYGVAKYLDASAIMDGRELKIFLVNRSLDQEHVVRVKLGTGGIMAAGSAESLSDRDPKTENSFEHPARVRACPHEDATVADGVATIILPPLCVYAGTFSLDA